MNKQRRLVEECPLEECSLLNRITYIWVSKFLWLTYRKKRSLPEGEDNVEVADADVFRAPGQQRAGSVTKRFTELFEAYRGPGRWRRSGYEFLKGFFAVSCSLEVFSVTLLTFVPLLAGYFINLLPCLDRLPWWYAYAIGVGFFGILVLRSLASNAHIQRTYEGVTAYELGLIGAIQAKSLRLSAGSRQKFGGGVGINLIGVDPLRIFTMAGLIPYVIAGPYQFVLTVVMLALSVGWSVVAGILILFLCFPIQFLMAKYISRFRKVPMTRDLLF
jgi:ABC-type multidrug transport system fused ATPase/permease subunit